MCLQFHAVTRANVKVKPADAVSGASPLACRKHASDLRNTESKLSFCTSLSPRVLLPWVSDCDSPLGLFRLRDKPLITPDPQSPDCFVYRCLPRL